jgi:hypothetical protein
MARGRVAIEVTGAPINLLKEFKEEFSRDDIYHESTLL